MTHGQAPNFESRNFAILLFKFRLISYVDSNDELNVAETPDVRVKFA